jgi:hypothetical protein
LKYGTHTAEVLSKEWYELYFPKDKGEIVPHMPVWTRTFKMAMRSLFSVTNLGLGTSSGRLVFIDVGSGMGKSSILCRMLYGNLFERDKIIGVELDERLVMVAEKNSEKMFKDKGNYINCNVLDFSFDSYLDATIVLFLYNPFGLKTLEGLLYKINNRTNNYFVYVNPIYEQVFRNFGYINLKYCRQKYSALSYSIWKK